jgi:hypothetical protein
MVGLSVVVLGSRIIRERQPENGVLSFQAAFG